MKRGEGRSRKREHGKGREKIWGEKDLEWGSRRERENIKNS